MKDISGSGDFECGIGAWEKRSNSPPQILVLMEDIFEAATASDLILLCKRGCWKGGDFWVIGRGSVVNFVNNYCICSNVGLRGRVILLLFLLVLIIYVKSFGLFPRPKT